MGLLGDFVLVYLQRRPDLIRLLTGVLRRHKPIPGAGKTIFVLRDDDVREVLGRHDDFELGPPNGPKMLCGPFLLGMDAYPQYERERSVLEKALKSAGPYFQTVVRSVCDAQATQVWGALSPGKCDLEVVSQYAEWVTTRVAAEFYGIPEDGAESDVLRGGEFEVFRLWLRKLGSVIATSAPAPFGLQEIGEACAEDLCEHVEAVVSDRSERIKHDPGDAGENLLDRLILGRQNSENDLDDAGLARNVIGLMLAGSAAITRSFVHVLDQFLRRPVVLEQAIAAAHNSDLKTLAELAEEAMRFNPTFAVLPRFCPRATTLAAGSSRQREIPAGATVFAVTLSAMFDTDALHQPEIFRPARKFTHLQVAAEGDPVRPGAPYTHLHFGTGKHQCLGARFATHELASMLRSFLALDWEIELGRDWRGKSRIRYDGIAVDRYEVGVYKPVAGAKP